MAARKRRFRLGLLINDLEGAYLEPLWKGVRDSCVKLNCDLFVFEGKLLESPVKQHKEQNLIYDIPKKLFLDGFLIIGSTMDYYCGEDTLIKFLQGFSPCPIVSLGRKLPGFPGVMVDGHASVVAMVLHLIQDHGRRNLIFLGGDVENEETQARLKGFLQGHEIAGIEIPTDGIHYPGFEQGKGYKATKEIIREYQNQKRPVDGILFGNDMAAFGGIKALDELGIRVPQDISVVGFDNLDIALSTIPPLTTVNQPLDLIAEKGVEYLLQVLESKVHLDPDLTIFVDSIPIFRQSCGCLDSYSSSLASGSFDHQSTWEKIIRVFQEYFQNPNEEDLLNHIYEILVSELKRLGSLGMYQNIGQVFLNKAKEIDYSQLNNSHFMELVLRIQMIFGALLSTGETLGKKKNTDNLWSLRHRIHEEITSFRAEEIYRQLSYVLTMLNLQGCSIALYGNGVINSNHIQHLPDTIRWVFSYWNNQTLPLPLDGLQGPINLPIPPGLDLYSSSAPVSLLYKPLFYHNEHFGFIVFNLGDTNEVLYEGFRSHLSGLLKASRVLENREITAKRLQESLLDLEKSNRTLKNLSIRDSLTGLFNRRGFLQLGENLMERARMLNETLLLIFIDLNFLKKINDNHGHGAGDLAIQDTAQVINESIRMEDIPARIGGDEFTILVPGTDESKARVFKDRIVLGLENVTKLHQRPFTLEMSIGFEVWQPTSKMSLEELLEKADRQMYLDKKKLSARTII